MSDDALIDAIETYKLDAAALSDAQLALLRKADAEIGQRAREKRAQAREAEEGAAVASLGLDWQRLKGVSVSEGLAHVVAEAIKSEIRKAQEEPAKQIAALKARVLELEAQAASRGELVP